MIAVLEFGRIGKADDGMCMPGSFDRAGKIKDPSAHAQVDQPESAWLQFGDQILASPMDLPDRPARERGRKGIGNRAA